MRLEDYVVVHRPDRRAITIRFGFTEYNSISDKILAALWFSDVFIGRVPVCRTLFLLAWLAPSPSYGDYASVFAYLRNLL